MKTFLLSSLAALTVITGCSLFAPPDAHNAKNRPAAPLPLVVRVLPSQTYQTMHSFGASDCWSAQFIGQNYPLAKREQIADWLFSLDTDAAGNPKGIGLSLWRFNIGAGSTEQGDSSGIKSPWRRSECFQRPDGTYDWSKQAGQQWFVEAAHRRRVPYLLGFTNSPPSNSRQMAKRTHPVRWVIITSIDRS